MGSFARIGELLVGRRRYTSRQRNGTLLMPRKGKKLEKFAFSCVVLMLAGCASNSGIVAMGPDTYFVSRQAATGFSGMGTLKAEAITEAGAFCIGKGKTAAVLSEKDAKPPYILGNYPKTEVTFKCV